MNLKKITDFDLKGKAVFLRLDFNVPLDDEGNITDDTRIQEALPTIRHAIEAEARVILASHLGRPKGKTNPKFSLEPVAGHLAELLQTEITLADDCVGDGIKLKVQSLKEGSVLLLENLRFHAEEEANSTSFSKRLADLCDIYITDAFGTAHRKHASTHGLPSLVESKGIGFLIEKELRYLEPLLTSPPQPFFAILGGAKVSDKIKTIESLLRNTKGLLIGGAMAYAFKGSLGEKIPPEAKQPKPEDIEAAGKVLRAAKKREIPVVLPADMKDCFDIGPKTIQLFCEKLKNAKLVFWNGPLGWFEKPEYAAGTFEVSRYLAELSCTKVVGGGDTVSAIKKAGVAEKFDHLSTGGGAVLEYLEGKGLPGIDVLKFDPKRESKRGAFDVSE